MSRRFSLATRTTLGLIGGLVSAGLLAGCSLLELRTSSPDEVETANLRISADQISYSFDGYCGVGVKIENLSPTPIKFNESDLAVFDGSSSTEWDLPFGGRAGSVTTEHRGYAIGEFPSIIEPGATATDAFVVYCKEGNTYTVTVTSLDGDSASFDFTSAPGG
ncbi:MULTISPECIES: hypothetical protein [Cryobacterium]|uniref:hypothetical protein n=1 Tax=Cryobacterium TaxID=69578 RepID=UPI00105746BF|nr:MULTISPECIES: hypothetical protein [Cryobacterium]TFC44729.1 hypothetical protein E3O57_10280 [Cryobacterium sp. TMN-39-2]TFC59629.1 hypothetical protein E3O60_08855 [Cryobacterium sp. TMB1-7]TFC87777.1 hypothetical protein E3T19_11645 [Cryobacterium sp. TMT4-31]